MKHQYITTEHEINNLKNYKFSGIDDGISYNYIFNPISESAQKYLPRWIA